MAAHSPKGLPLLSDVDGKDNRESYASDDGEGVLEKLVYWRLTTTKAIHLLMPAPSNNMRSGLNSDHQKSQSVSVFSYGMQIY